MAHSLFLSSSVSSSPRRSAAGFVSLCAHIAGITALVSAPFLSDAELPPVPLPPSPPLTLPVVRLAGGGGPRPLTPRPTTVRPPSTSRPSIPVPREIVPLTPVDGADDAPACPDCVIGDAGEPGDSIEGDGSGPGVGPIGPGLEPGPEAAPIRVSSLTPPRRLVYVEPQYPEAARHIRMSGVVILECVIDTRGRVADVKVLRGRPLLDEAALTAVSQWVYAPTLLGGVPVAVVMTVTVRFQVP